MARQLFPAVRDLPSTGVPAWEYDLLMQIKESLEILTGQRANAGRAVMSSNLTIAQQDNVYLKRVTAIGTGYNISGNLVADLSDYRALIQNVQDLASSMILLQKQVNDLIGQLEA